MKKYILLLSGLAGSAVVLVAFILSEILSSLHYKIPTYVFFDFDLYSIRLFIGKLFLIDRIQYYFSFGLTARGLSVFIAVLIFYFLVGIIFAKTIIGSNKLAKRVATSLVVLVIFFLIWSAFLVGIVKANDNKEFLKQQLLGQAKTQKDFQLCDEIGIQGDIGLKYSCYGEVAAVKKDVTVCLSIPKEWSITCYDLVAEAIQDSSICENIQLDDNRKTCMAVAEGDRNKCNLVSEQNRDWCYSRFEK